MADSTTVNYNTVSDLPEYEKPYYQMLLNAVTGSVFDPKYTAAQLGSTANIPNATGSTATPTNSATLPYQPPTTPATTDPTATTPLQSPVTPFGSRPASGTVDPIAGRSATGDNAGISDIVTRLLNQRVFQRLADGGSVAPTSIFDSGASPLLTNNVLGGSGYNVGVGSPVNAGTSQPVSPVTYGGQQGIQYITPSGLVQPGSGVNTNPWQPIAYQTSGQANTPGVGATPGTPGTGVNPGGNSGYAGFQPLPGSMPGQYVPTPGTPGLKNPSPSQNLGQALGLVPAGTNKGIDVSPEEALKLAKQVGGQGIAETDPQGLVKPAPQSIVDMGTGRNGNGIYMNSNLLQRTVSQPGWEKHITDELAAAKAPASDIRSSAYLYNNGNPGGNVFAGQSWNPNGYAQGGILSLAQPKHYDLGGLTDGTTPTGATPPATAPADAGFGGGIFQPYQAYQGQRILSSDPNADPTKTWTISPRTAQAENQMSSMPQQVNAQGQIVDPNLAHARDLMTYSADQTGSTMGELNRLANKYDSANSPLQSHYQSMQYDPASFTAGQVDPSKLVMGSAGQVKMDPLQMYQQTGPSQWTDQGVQNAYMDPYQQAVTNAQKQALTRNFNEAKQTRDAAAVGAGAFGGTRQAVADSLANRDYQQQLGQVDATGLNNAYLNAQQQFGADRTSAEAAKANNLNAAINTQGLNTNAQLQAALANQGAALNQYGQMYQGQLQGALANQTAGLTAQQLAEQSRQFGANLTDTGNKFADSQQLNAGLSSAQLQQAALGQSLNAQGQMTNGAATQADLARLAQQLQIQNTGQLSQAGAAEDARRQAGLNLGYQDFLNQKNYPFQLSNFYSGILRGVPTSFNQDQVQVQQSNYNPLAQGIGNVAGLAGLFGGATK